MNLKTPRNTPRPRTPPKNANHAGILSSTISFHASLQAQSVQHNSYLIHPGRENGTLVLTSVKFFSRKSRFAHRDAEQTQFTLSRRERARVRGPLQGVGQRDEPISNAKARQPSSLSHRERAGVRVPSGWTGHAS